MTVPVCASLGYLEAALLGVLQGVTEFLPVSSSGHLALATQAARRMGGSVPESGVAFELLVHLATLVVVVGQFRKSIAELLGRDRIVIGYLIVGTLPAVAAGLAFRPVMDDLMANPFVVSAALCVTGAFLIVCDRLDPPKRSLRMLGPGRALVIGLAQALAIVPGVSRSGLTITGGAICGLSREDAVRFGFLLMIPAVLGAACLDLVEDGASWAALDAGPAALGFLTACGSGWLALRLLRMLVRTRRLTWFAVYCFAMAATGVLWLGLS